MNENTPQSGPETMQSCEGRLPYCAPLANPYVPFQQESPLKYEARRGLIRGTLFPGLDLPFMGKSNETELTNTPLAELQALNFAITELSLYLDTHRDDEDALELYRAYQELYEKGVQTYNETYGPLTHNQVETTGTYRWLKDPWPWEYRENEG